jgi:hypothetical protein
MDRYKLVLSFLLFGSLSFAQGPSFVSRRGGTGTVSVVSAGTLTNGACVTGGGAQTIQTPSPNCTVDASGNLVANSLTSGSGTAPALPSGTASCMFLGTTNYTGWCIPTVLSQQLALIFPNAVPTANQFLLMGATSGGESSGVWTTFSSTNLTDTALLARLASPAFTGTPTAPTQTPGDNTTKLATDAFVTAAIAAAGTGTGGSVTSVTPVTATANTTADQQLMELTMSAGYFNSLRQPFLFNGAGVFTTPIAQTPTLTFKVKLCTVSGCGSGTVVTLVSIVTTATLASSTNNNWNFSFLGYTATTGATGNLEIHGPLSVDLGALGTSPDSIFNDVNTAVSGNIDLTAALFVDFTVATSTGSASNAITQRAGAVMPFAATAAPVTSVNGLTGAVTGITQTIATGSTAFGTSSISGNSCATTITVAATGAVVATDRVTWTPNADLSATTGYGVASTDGLKVYTWLTAGNINFHVCNGTGTAIVPGAVTAIWGVSR